ncbi:MAG: GlsB/YeaQ/YmgE family stress response membrane protein [Chitinophagales bacterium]
MIYWAIFGLLAGAIAKFLMPGNDPGGYIITSIIGVIGAYIGGFIGRVLGFGGVQGFDLTSIILAVVGSIILLIAYRRMTS